MNRDVGRRVLLVPVSPGYNLGIDKLKTWLGGQGAQVSVARSVSSDERFDLYGFSAVFTWDLPRLAELVHDVPSGAEVWIGGPAASAMPDWVESHTGIKPVIGPDPRFERQQGSYRWCRTSRGCPVGCYFCIVPKIDGTAIREYRDFDPAPVVVDDNILRTSWAHQAFVVDRLAACDFKAIDFNSGFDPHIFSQKHFDLYSKLSMRMWRIAFDEMAEKDDVRRAIQLLRANGVPSRKILCYVLAGNERFADCMARAWMVVGWGGEPVKIESLV